MDEIKEEIVWNCWYFLKYVCICDFFLVVLFYVIEENLL